MCTMSINLSSRFSTLHPGIDSWYRQPFHDGIFFWVVPHNPEGADRHACYASSPTQQRRDEDVYTDTPVPTRFSRRDCDRTHNTDTILIAHQQFLTGIARPNPGRCHTLWSQWMKTIYVDVLFDFDTDGCYILDSDASVRATVAELTRCWHWQDSIGPTKEQLWTFCKEELNSSRARG
jgi:hypothetical protein